MAAELQWKEEVHSFIRLNIAPISVAYTTQQLYDALLSQLLTSCGDVLPTTHELLNVAKLLRYKESFCADFSIGTLQNGDELPRRSLILFGFLDANVSSGSVVLKDLSGEIDCEVCATVDDISCCVLLLKWNFIYVDSNKCGSYLEVQNLHALLKKACPQYSTTSLVQCFTQKTKMKRFSVHGQVKMVSHICRTAAGSGHLFTVQLNDPVNPEVAVGLVIESPHLMHTASLLRIGQCYQFTCVREMVMNKDLSKIRVLSCSEGAEIWMCHCLDWNVQCSVSKRSRPNDSVPELRLEKNDEQLLPGALLTFYRGKVSKCLIPEAGMYEMEGGVRLYMTHLLCPNLCRGIREGALLELHNIHVMNRTLMHPSIYCCRVSTIRVVQFSQLSSGFTPFCSRTNKVTSLVMSLSAKDMVWLMEGLLTFKEKFQANGRWDLRTSVKVLQALSTQCVPHKAFKSYLLMEEPHKCPAMEDVDMTRQVWPGVWSIQSFIDHVTTVVERNDFHWLSGPCELEDQREGLYQVSLCSSAKWKYGIVDWPYDVLLIGCLQGNCRTGQLELVDSTGALPVALSAVVTHTTATDDDLMTSVPMTTPTTRAPPHLSDLVGSYIGIGNCKVVYERIERLGCACVNVIYLCVSGLNDVTLYASNVRGAAVRCQHHTVTSSIPATTTYYIRVTAKGSVRLDDPNGPVQFVAHVLLHEDLSALKYTDMPCPRDDGHVTIPAVLRFTGPLVHWHWLLHHKCLYSVTSVAPCLPAAQVLAQNPYIIVCENMAFRLLGVCPSTPPSILDIADIMSHVLIPSPYNTTLTRPSCASGSDTGSFLAPSFHHRLVSFNCVIKEHTYRFGQDFCNAIIGRSNVPESVFRSQVLALKVKSPLSSDTMMVYCDLKYTDPTHIGLVPGTMATFYNIQLKTSKLGNVYAVSVALSDVEITSFSVDPPANHSTLLPSLGDVPNVLLYDLNEAYTQGRLSRSIVCVNGVFTSVQHISLQLKCSACQSLFISNHCSNMCCMEKKPVLMACARLIVDDGSGEGYVYCYDDLVTAAIKIPPLEWSSLLEMLKSCGKAYYSRQQNSLWNYGHVPMLEAKAHLKLTEIVQKWFILRRVSVCCQPFVSTADRREHTLGHRTYHVKVGCVDYITVAPPRLQLRAVSLSNVNAISECHKLHCKIK